MFHLLLPVVKCVPGLFCCWLLVGHVLQLMLHWAPHFAVGPSASQRSPQFRPCVSQFANEWHAFAKHLSVVPTAQHVIERANLESCSAWACLMLRQTCNMEICLTDDTDQVQGIHKAGCGIKEKNPSGSQLYSDQPYYSGKGSDQSVWQTTTQPSAKSQPAASVPSASGTVQPNMPDTSAALCSSLHRLCLEAKDTDNVPSIPYWPYKNTTG